VSAPNVRTASGGWPDAEETKTDSGSVAADFERLKWRFDTRRITLAWLPSGELVVHQGSWVRVLPDLAAAHHFARLCRV
jgi:hypothetical protein